MTVGPRFLSRIHGKMRPSFAAMQIIEVISGVGGVQNPHSIRLEKTIEQSRLSKFELSAPGRQDGGCE